MDILSQATYDLYGQVITIDVELVGDDWDIGVLLLIFIVKNKKLTKLENQIYIYI